MANTASNINGHFVGSTLTLSAFVATHKGYAEDGKIKHVTTADGDKRRYIHCADGTQAWLSVNLNSEFEKARAEGRKFKFDQSKLTIQAWEGNKGTSQEGKGGYTAYYSSAEAENEEGYEL